LNLQDLKVHRGFRVLQVLQVDLDRQDPQVLKVFKVLLDLQVLLDLKVPKVSREPKVFRVLKVSKVLQVLVVLQVAQDPLVLKVLMETLVALHLITLI
jgi:hypothetical protein